MPTTYKIGEAAALLNLKTYVLRFWETEFPDIVPLRTEKGQRLYTDEHLALLERIRYLLHERGLTIGGARKILLEEKERGVVYEFGVPGPDPDITPDMAAEEDAEPVAGMAMGLFAAAEEDSEDDEGVPDWPDLQSPALQAATARGAAAVRQLAQFNLPGIIPPPRFDSPLPGIGEGGEGEAGGFGVSSEAEQAMLPLFAVAKAAFMAGRAAGASQPGPPLEGGANFIQTGTDSGRPSLKLVKLRKPVEISEELFLPTEAQAKSSAAPEPAPAPKRNAVPEPVPVPKQIAVPSPSTDLIGELETLAAILRGDIEPL